MVKSEPHVEIATKVSITVLHVGDSVEGQSSEGAPCNSSVCLGNATVGWTGVLLNNFCYHTPLFPTTLHTISIRSTVMKRLKTSESCRGLELFVMTSWTASGGV